jgi:hypothetical protein
VDGAVQATDTSQLSVSPHGPPMNRRWSTMPFAARIATEADRMTAAAAGFFLSLPT